MSDEWTFHLRVNGGVEQTLTTVSGTYRNVVAAVPAMLGVEGEPWPIHVEIWVPRLVESGYGPYHYVIDDDRGTMQILNAVRGAKPQSEQ